MGQVIERLFDWAYHVEELDEQDKSTNFRIAFQSYGGKPLELSDGTRVERGARVAELHQKNDVLAGLHRQYGSPRRVGVAYTKLMQQSVIALARVWANDPRFEGVVAVYGRNIFPEFAERGGFESREVLPVWRRRMISWWVRRIVASAHPKGRERVMKDGRPREVMEVWISRGKCLALHGRGGEDLDAMVYVQRLREQTKAEQPTSPGAALEPAEEPPVEAVGDAPGGKEGQP
jgi:hypothetical protein